MSRRMRKKRATPGIAGVSPVTTRLSFGTDRTRGPSRPVSTLPVSSWHPCGVAKDYERADWLRLGRAIKRARMSHPTYRNTQEWASAVGRSSRVVLGLERGEPTGDETLMRVEQLLDWPADFAWNVLDNLVTLDAGHETVSTPAQTPDENTIMFRRPEGMSEAEWELRRARLAGYWHALLDEAAEER